MYSSGGTGYGLGYYGQGDGKRGETLKTPRANIESHIQCIGTTVLLSWFLWRKLRKNGKTEKRVDKFSFGCWLWLGCRDEGDGKTGK
jgi:hypothetical protein